MDERIHPLLYRSSHWSAGATCCQNKRKLIFPAWIGCCRKKDFNVSLSHWSWTQQGTFLPEPSVLFLQPLNHADLLVGPRPRSQAALQAGLLISSHIMANSETHGWWERVGITGGWYGDVWNLSESFANYITVDWFRLYSDINSGILLACEYTEVFLKTAWMKDCRWHNTWIP